MGLLGSEAGALGSGVLINWLLAGRLGSVAPGWVGMPSEGAGGGCNVEAGGAVRLVAGMAGDCVSDSDWVIGVRGFGKVGGVAAGLGAVSAGAVSQAGLGARITASPPACPGDAVGGVNAGIGGA